MGAAWEYLTCLGCRRAMPREEQHIAFVPFVGFLAASFGGKLELQLKVATLYYDALVIPADRVWYDNLVRGVTEWGAPAGEIRKAWWCVEDVAPGFDDFVKRQYSRQSLEDRRRRIFDAAGEVQRGLRGPATEFLRQSFGVSRRGLAKIREENRQAYVRELYWTVTASLMGAEEWCYLRPYRDLAYVAFHRIDVASCAEVLGGTEPDFTEPLTEGLEAFVPSVRDLEWEDVFWLRQHEHARAFRRAVRSVLGLDPSSQWKGERRVVDEALQRANDQLWAAAMSAAPNVGEEVLRGLISNLPLPLPINPAGVADSIYAGVSAARWRRKYGWLVFLHELRARAEENESHPTPEE